ncbi:MAG TPA: FeoC-like transcriptional regulator [Alkalispirochaeta sp.]|nr:FeoC-like transcriptional regulator [Alkalispirochaeta sp.]
MIVAEVKREMQTRRRATISQLAAELGESPGRIADAMRLHVERGRVSRELLMPDAGCDVTGCAHCPLVGACTVHETQNAGVEVFVWNKAEHNE